MKFWFPWRNVLRRRILCFQVGAFLFDNTVSPLVSWGTECLYWNLRITNELFSASNIKEAVACSSLVLCAMKHWNSPFVRQRERRSEDWFESGQAEEFTLLTRFKFLLKIKLQNMLQAQSYFIEPTNGLKPLYVTKTQQTTCQIYPPLLLTAVI